MTGQSRDRLGLTTIAGGVVAYFVALAFEVSEFDRELAQFRGSVRRGEARTEELGFFAANFSDPAVDAMSDVIRDVEVAVDAVAKKIDSTPRRGRDKKLGGLIEALIRLFDDLKGAYEACVAAQILRKEPKKPTKLR